MVLKTKMTKSYDFELGEPIYVEQLNMICNVEKEMGSGTQGKVYSLISPDNSLLALKWYFPSMATREQLEILKSLVDKQSPSDKFLWPIALVESDKKEGFGYVMPLKENRFKSFGLWLSRKIDPSFKVLLTACYEICKSFHLLHSKGFCYQDLSLNNLYFDPCTGEIRIGDTDNIIINGSEKGNVIGTPKFMAPEIITHKALPNTQTDLYSLAVLLFYILFVNHPLEGKAESNIKSLDVPAMTKLYGLNPVFIFDPVDSSNHPDPVYHKNALIFWKIYPEFFKNLFIKAFTEGIRDPLHGRVRETEWQIALLQLRDSIYYCNKCGSENFFYPINVEVSRLRNINKNITNYDNSVSTVLQSMLHLKENDYYLTCWNPRCQNTSHKVMYIIIDERYFITLNHDTRIFLHHVDPCNRYDFSHVIAAVTKHPVDDEVWGLKNTSSRIWKVEKPNSKAFEVLPNQNLLLSPNITIDFGTSKGIIYY
ncbi:Serine/threonine-protein kinase [Candidatus Nitrosocosmicus franklandus]|uniref:Serine/threonine-protein kinase n=2 Tax=Candidatus Nitrosocosmicus franklandianus TaxID=1798806 RepID=A0A484IAI0_9ARCH|nr:Serine/threonine-protein kinase [Candidatus Nitrosocosmicus franklandus]